MNSNKVLGILIIVFLVVFGVTVVFNFHLQFLINKAINNLSLSPIGDDSSEGGGERRCECAVLEGTVITPTENPYIKYKAHNSGIYGQCPGLDLCSSEPPPKCAVSWVIQKVDRPSRSWFGYSDDDLMKIRASDFYYFAITPFNRLNSYIAYYDCGIVSY